YQLDGGRSYIWNSGDQLLTEIRGPQTYRLPRPADLVPPALARRLLSEAGRQASYRVIAPVRVAGRNAAGLRVTPTDPASTIGRVALPAELGGRIRQPVQPGFEEIGVYGGGLSTFVVLGVRGSAGRSLIPDAISAGGTPLSVASGPGVVIGAPLVNAIIFRPA